MQLNALFANGAVLQAGKPVSVFGQAESPVTVEFAGQVKTAPAIGGRFDVTLDPMPYGGPYVLRVTGDGETVERQDVYVGEVYLAAGQSNMQFKLGESTYPAEAYFDDGLLRLFSTERLEKGDPYHPSDGWVAATRETVGRFPAIGALVGELIRKKKDVAVGIITCYQGASVIEAWMPFAVATEPRFTIPEEEKYGDHHVAHFLNWNHPGRLYDYTFRAIAPYAVSAVIWYQGESDVTDAEAVIYKDELLAMIDAWRADMRDAALPFIVVQIADFVGRDFPAWHAIQQAQADAADPEKHIFLAVSRDVCEDNDIHPKTKHLLAERIAALL